MIRKKLVLKFNILFVLLVCVEPKRNKTTFPSKRYLRNSTGFSFQNGGHQNSLGGDMVLDESLVHVGGLSMKSFGGGDEGLQHAIDHLAGNDRDQPILGIGLQQRQHRTKYNGGGVDYNEYSHPNHMMMHTNGEQDFFSDKVHMNDIGHLSTNDPMLGGARHRDLYAHTRNTDGEDRRAPHRGNTKQIVHHLQTGDLIGVNPHRHGMGNELMAQAHHRHRSGQINDTMHQPSDASDMYNMHASPHNADDHEYIPSPATEGGGMSHATDENYDSTQLTDGACDDHDRQRRNCPNLIRIDKKIVRLPVPSASGHHAIRAHNYNNTDNGDEDDLGNGRNGVEDAPLPKKTRQGFGNEPNDDSWMKMDDDVPDGGKDVAEDNRPADDDGDKTHEEHHIKHGDDGDREEHHLKHKTGKNGDDIEVEHRTEKGDPANGEAHSHYHRHRYKDEPETEAREPEEEKEEKGGKEEKEEKEVEEKKPKKKKRKTHKKRIHHMVFSEDDQNPFHDHTKDVVESGDEEPDEEEKALVLDKSVEKPSKSKKLVEEPDAKAETAKGKKGKAESAEDAVDALNGAKDADTSKNADPEKLLKVAKQIADMEEKIRKISKLPLMEPFKPDDDKDKNPIPSTSTNSTFPDPLNTVLLTTPPPTTLSTTTTTTTTTSTPPPAAPPPQDANVHQSGGEVLANPPAPVNRPPLMQNATLPEPPKETTQQSMLPMDDATKEKSAKQFLNVLQEGLRILRNKTQASNYGNTPPGKILTALEDGLRIIKNRSITTPPPKAFRTSETDAVIFVKAAHDNKEGPIRIRDDNEARIHDTESAAMSPPINDNPPMPEPISPPIAAPVIPPINPQPITPVMKTGYENEALNELETLIRDAQRGRDPWTHCPECPKLRSIISKYKQNVNRILFLDRKSPRGISDRIRDRTKGNRSYIDTRDKTLQGNASLSDLEALIKDSENTKTALVNCSRWRRTSSVKRPSNQPSHSKNRSKYDLVFTQLNKRFTLTKEKQKNHTLTVGELIQNIETLNDLDSLMRDSEKVQEYICKSNSRRTSDEPKKAYKHNKKNYEYVFSQVGRKRHLKWKDKTLKKGKH